MYPLTASAQLARMYKWVDDRGVVTYSDRRPIDQKVIDGVQHVSRTISLYTPDPALLQAVAAARQGWTQPHADAGSPRSFAPASAPGPMPFDPCAQTDCTEFSPYRGGYAVRHPRQHVVQAVLPAGAIAGTVNANGTIPGQTGGNAILPGPFNYLPAPAGKARAARGPLEPPRTPLSGDR